MKSSTPRPRSAQLHRAADLSRAKAHQFARTFRDLGLLAWDRSEFQITDRRRLFDRWYEAENRQSFDRYPVRQLLPSSEDPLEVFRDENDTRRYAIGGFEACALYDVLHTSRQLPEIHIFEPPVEVEEAHDLERCSKHDAEMQLVRGPLRESIQRGLQKRDGLLVVDILQAALDAGRCRKRVQEQADHMVNHVLEW